MDGEIALLLKKTAKVDRLMKKGGPNSPKTPFYEVKREKYIGELGELAHLDSHYLYETTNPDIRNIQTKISTLDKQMMAMNPGSSKAHNFPKHGRHSQYIQQLNDRDKYIKELGELVYKDDHYKKKKNREKENSESSSITELGGSMASLGFNTSSSSLLGASLASFGGSFNASFSSIKEDGDDDDNEQQFLVELPPESTIVIQRDEPVYDVIDKLVEGGKPENSHIVNILFASQQHALDDIVMSALEKIMLRTIKEQNRKWQIVRFEQCYEIPYQKDSKNNQQLHTCRIHQEKIKDKITRLIHTLHRNLRDTKQFNKFNDLDRHDDGESTGSRTRNQYGEFVFYVTSNCTLVFKKNVP